MKVTAKALRVSPVEILVFSITIEDTREVPDVYYYPAAEFIIVVHHNLPADHYVITSVTIEGRTPVELLVVSASRVLAQLEGWKHWTISPELL